MTIEPSNGHGQNDRFGHDHNTILSSNAWSWSNLTDISTMSTTRNLEL
jgi:hypothetical protein